MRFYSTRTSALRGRLIETCDRDLRNPEAAEIQIQKLIEIASRVQARPKIDKKNAELLKMEDLKPAKPLRAPKTPDEREAEAEILAYTASLLAEEKRRRLWGPRVTEKGIEHMAQAAEPRCRLILGLAEARGLKAVELCNKPQVLFGLLPQAEQFAEAILPTRLGVLAPQAVFKHRLQAWLDQCRMSSAEFCRWLRQLWMPIEGMTRAGMRRLIGKVTLRLLRTYPERMLVQTGRLFVENEPILNYIRDGEPDTQEMRDKVFGMLGKIQRRLERIGEARSYSAEDAVSDAIEVLKKKMSNTLEGYLFRAPLEFYIGGIAENFLRAEIHLDHFIAEDEDGTLIERVVRVGPGQRRRLQAREEKAREPRRKNRDPWLLPKDWDERFEVVLSYNKLGTRERARIILKAIRDTIQGMERVRDEVLCARIVAQTGRPLRVATLQNARWRLRQRLFVCTYILDMVAAGASDGPGDASLLEALDKQDLAASTEDMPTVRAEAALFRASRGDASLGWVLLCRMLFEPLGLSREQVLAVARGMIEAAEDWDPDALQQELEWIADTFVADRAAGLAATQQFAKHKKILFLISSSWYLIRVRGLDVEGVLKRLKPETGQVKNVRELLNRIAAFGKQPERRMPPA